MKETFTWPVKIGADGETEFNKKTIQYDNGYEQNISVGRNNQREKWNVSITDKESVIEEIKAFIKRHAGVKSFYWTPPLCEQGLFLADNPKMVAHGGTKNKKMYTLSFEMRQVFSAADSKVTSTPVYSVNGKTPTDGNVSITAYDIGAEEKGAAAAAIKGLKTETNPLSQYAFKKDIPDIKPLVASIEVNRTDITNLTEKLADTNEYAQELHSQLETASTELYRVADAVVTNKDSIDALTTGLSTTDKAVTANEKAITKLDTAAVKSVNGNKPDDKGDAKVINDKLATDTTTFSGTKINTELQTFKDGITTELDKLKEAMQSNAIPLFFVSWWPLRASIPAGFVAADGQELSVLTFPEAAKAIAEGVVPVVSEEEWQADPFMRVSYVAASSEGKFRIADLNGCYADSLGAVFLRGGSGDVIDTGRIYKDALGDAYVPITYTANNNALGAKWNGSKIRLMCGIDMAGSGWTGGTANWVIIEDLNKINFGNSETRPLNTKGCWIIKLYGAVVNTSQADFAQLVSDYANLVAKFSSFESWLKTKKFTLIYPNNGTEEKPAEVTVNTRYIMDNPFPNTPVICEAEILANGVWGTSGWLYANGGYGVSSGHLLETDKVIVQTGNVRVANISYQTGGTLGQSLDLSKVPCRVKVWRVI